MQKKICTLFVSCALTTSVIAQNSYVHGNVLYNNKQHAPFSKIFVAEAQINIETDHDGYFTIPSLPYGTYQFHIQQDEETPESITVHISKDTTLLPLILKQNNKAESFEEIKYVEKVIKKEIESKGFAVNVIETKVAALQNVQTTELLDRSAGVRIRQDGGLGSHTHYNINGLSGNAVKIFIDGVPIANYGNSFSLNSLPPALIERIEVYKGVVPAHLSEDALGGAINVILKNKNKNSLTASYSFGSFNTHQAHLNGAFRNTKNGLTVNGSVFYNYSDNNYKVWGKDIFITDSLGKTTPTTAKRFHDAYKSLGAKVDAGYTNVKWADAFTIGAVVSQTDKEVQHGTIMRIVYGNRTTNQESAVFSTQYRKHNLIKGLDINFNASYSLLSRGIIDTIGDMYTWNGSIVTLNGNPIQWRNGAEQGNPTNAIDKENNLTARANIAFAINNKNKVYGNVFYNSFDRSSTDSKKPQAEQALDDTRNLAKAVYGITYENLSLKKKLRTNIFYKYFAQHHELIQPYWEGSVGTGKLLTRNNKSNVGAGSYGAVLSYNIAAKVHLMASTEKALRMPNANELFGNAADNITATSTLKPESSTNINFGINIGTINWDQHHINVNTNFFYRETKDMIRLNTIDDLDQTNEYANFESILSNGFDAEITYNFKRRFFITFTVSKFNSKWNVEYNQKGERYQHFGSQLANEPDFKFNLNLAYNIPNFIQKNALFTIHANVFYVDEFLRNWATYGGNNISVIPTQFTQDIGINYTFPNRKIILGFDAKNITNQQVFDNWALQKPGRAFYGKITYTIF
jgi:outer membrane receptor protein involved in Fe transport